MPNTPLLTVAIEIDDQQELIEPTLTALFSLFEINFELFLINNGNDDESDKIIRSVAAQHRHENTYYYTNDPSINRGVCLNEVLFQCNGEVFWAPRTLYEINKESLQDSLTQLINSEKVGVYQQKQQPHSHQQWLGLIRNNKWPADGNILWNLENIPPKQRFFNASLNRFCDIELAARLNADTFIASNQPWCQPYESKTADLPSFSIKQEILFSRLRHKNIESSQYNTLLEELQKLKESQVKDSKNIFSNPALNKASKLKQEGQFNDSLKLIDQVLTDHPNHSSAQQLKIEVLEKKQRYVEASELAHQAANTSDEESSVANEPKKDSQSKTITVIIPTAAYGKQALEHCLLSLSENCDTSILELLIIDNASLDDTHDYLDELKEKQFLNCRVITNKYNRGFAASVNQGLQEVSTKYACILHNDVEFTEDVLSKLYSLLEANPEYAVLGPVTDKTLNPDQSQDHLETDAPEIISAEYLGSFCFMLRTKLDVKMDEAYELAFFEDIDFCFQIQQQGYKVGISTDSRIKHYFGTTTFSLDLDTESEQYWKNVAYFNEKWDIELFSEKELKSLSRFDQLLALDDLVNPLFPEKSIKDHFNQLLTDELRTEILNRSHDEETLCKLVHLFMVMDEREVMRRLEDRLEHLTLPASLIYQLVHFYYNKNIYSRCLHYLDQLDPQNESLRSELYRLAIYVENKELNHAVPLLRELMEHAPANPQLYKLAGELHKVSGNTKEAASFYQLAEQINPFEFSEQQTDAFGFEL